MTDTSSFLELRFEPDSDGTGELFASVRRGHFSGVGSAWFHTREIEAFSRKIKDTYPIPQDSEIELQGGYWKSGANPPKLEEVLVRLRVYPVGSTGCIGLQIHVMEGKYDGQRQESRASLCVELLTDYQSIQDFGAGVAYLLTDASASARLSANAA